MNYQWLTLSKSDETYLPMAYLDVFFFLVTFSKEPFLALNDICHIQFK